MVSVTKITCPSIAGIRTLTTFSIDPDSHYLFHLRARILRVFRLFGTTKYRSDFGPRSPPLDFRLRLRVCLQQQGPPPGPSQDEQQEDLEVILYLWKEEFLNGVTGSFCRAAGLLEGF